MRQVIQPRLVAMLIDMNSWRLLVDRYKDRSMKECKHNEMGRYEYCQSQIKKNRDRYDDRSKSNGRFFLTTKDFIIETHIGYQI